MLVAEDGEPLLEGQLEPVAARDPVARPVVEVLVSNDALHTLIVGVCSGRRLGEHTRGVEDVEALVLHGAHVEIVDGDNVVYVKIVLEAVGSLVPLHGVLERLHRPIELVDVLALRPDGEPHLAAGHGGEGALDAGEVSRDECKEVGWLYKGVDKLGPVTAVGGVACTDLVAVREQERELLLVGLDAHRIRRHHVRTVRKVSDPTESLCLALSAQVAARLVQPGELRILMRLDRNSRRENECIGWRLQQRESFFRQLEVLAFLELAAIDVDTTEREVLAM
mmetsp:Transcript_24/g.72  ORF Transcript_24/g.72 Transcript_24/m.72 type:complete len:280 (+) Transcript_24:1752-2591(+)